MLIIDDHSDDVVVAPTNDPRIRVVRSAERMGLIGARFMGGNEARGEYLAFIDAHVVVGPNWLTTPHRYLTENKRSIVNFINFSLDPVRFRPMNRYGGMGR